VKNKIRNIQLGRLRSISLFYDVGQNKIDEDFSYLIESKKVIDVFGKDKPLIIGLIDGNHCILIDMEKKGPVFIDFNFLSPDQLIQIADSLSGLNKILSWIIDIWKGKENHYSLKKDEKTIFKYKRVIEKIENENLRSNTMFWKYYAFRELEIDIH
jgi:hypothetical protein